MGAGESRIGVGLANRIPTVDGLRCSGMKREHGQTMIRAQKTIFVLRLRESGPSGGSGSCTARKTGHGESSTWKHGLATRIQCSLTHRQRSAFPSSVAGCVQGMHVRSGLKPPWKRNKSCAQVNNPHYHCNTLQGLPRQHHTATAHAGTHGGVWRLVEKGQGGT